jgi:hypothetical protein
MSIHLLIKGNVGQAYRAAHDRGISLNKTWSNARHPNEMHARCASDYRSRVVAWFAEEPRHAPFPDGTLLLFTETEGLES